MSDWYALYANDMYVNDESMYELDPIHNEWDVVYWSIKYVNPCFNIDHLALLMTKSHRLRY